MQLQKLTYIAHGYHLALTGRPLLNVPVSAWKYGPVIPSLYDVFKDNGRSGITVPPVACGGVLDADAGVIIDAVYAAYGKHDGRILSELTHRAGTPWSNTYSEYTSTVIPDEAIKSYYMRLISKEDSCKGL
jgi:uncharacterized phage-associated protein